MDIKYIDRYLSNDMSHDEVLLFKDKLKSDSNIRSDYRLMCEVDNAIMEDDIMDMRSMLGGIYAENFKTTEKKKIINIFSNSKLYYAAASLALLITTGGLLYNNYNKQSSTSAIFDEYYKPYESTSAFRSGDIKTDALLFNAMHKYQQEDYSGALSMFEEILSKNGKDLTANLYSGISYLETEEYKNATNSFQSIVANNDNLFVEQAKWYLAMCYVKTDSVHKAEVLFNELIKSDSYYKDDSEEIIKLLDELDE